MNFFKSTNTSDQDTVLLVTTILLSAGFVTCLFSSLCGTVGYLLGKDSINRRNINRNQGRTYNRLDDESRTKTRGIEDGTRELNIDRVTRPTVAPALTTDETLAFGDTDEDITGKSFTFEDNLNIVNQI